MLPSFAFMNSWLTKASKAIEGIFPKKVVTTNINEFTLLNAAPKVINPEGINGINLPSKIRTPAFQPLLFTKLSTNLYFPNIEVILFLNLIYKL